MYTRRTSGGAFASAAGPAHRAAGAGRGVGSGGGDLRRVLSDPLRVALVLSTIFGISRIHQHFGFIGALRPGLLLFLFCVGYAFAVPSSVRWGVLKENWPSRGVLWLGAIALVGIPFGLSLGGSATFMINVYSRVLLVFAVLMAATRSIQDVRLWTWAYLWSVLLLIWMGLFVMDTAAAGGSDFYRLQSSYMYDGNDLGVILMVGLPFALLLLQSSGKMGKLMTLPVLLGAPVTIALTGSRGAFVGLVVVGAALFLLVTHIPLVKRLSVAAVLGVGVMVAAPEGYWDQMRTIIEPEDDYNLTADSGRKAIWLRGMSYMAQFPILGVGMDNFTRAEGTISEMARNAVPGIGVPMLAPHNTFVQVGAELGIPALLIWISFFWLGVVTLTRVRKRLPPEWARGSPDERFLYYSTFYMPVAFLGLASTTFFVSHLYLPGIYTMLAILGGLLMEIRRRVPEALPKGGKRVTGRGGVGHRRPAPGGGFRGAPAPRPPTRPGGWPAGVPRQGM